jgi:hypothetical protein
VVRDVPFRGQPPKQQKECWTERKRLRTLRGMNETGTADYIEGEA